VGVARDGATRRIDQAALVEETYLQLVDANKKRVHVANIFAMFIIFAQNEGDLRADRFLICLSFSLDKKKNGTSDFYSVLLDDLLVEYHVL